MQRNRKQVSRKAPSASAMSVLGRRISCPPDPPAVTLMPWYPLTLTGIVSLTSAGAVSNITVANVISALGAQFNITASGVRVRAQRVRAWLPLEQSVAVSGRPYGFSVIPYSFTTGVGMSDYGDTNSRLNYARVGFEWPASDRAVPLFAGTTIVFTAAAGEVPASVGAKVYWQLEILWQFNTFETPGRSVVVRTVPSLDTGFGVAAGRPPQIGQDPATVEEATVLLVREGKDAATITDDPESIEEGKCCGLPRFRGLRH
jgi:hypothetical protein